MWCRLLRKPLFPRGPCDIPCARCHVARLNVLLLFYSVSYSFFLQTLQCCVGNGRLVDCYARGRQIGCVVWWSPGGWFLMLQSSLLCLLRPHSWFFLWRSTHLNCCIDCSSQDHCLGWVSLVDTLMGWSWWRQSGLFWSRQYSKLRQWCQSSWLLWLEQPSHKCCLKQSSVQCPGCCSLVSCCWLRQSL